MKVLRPAALTLTASSVPETEYPAWAAATSYAVGFRVIRTTTHRVYERQSAGVSSATPETDDINWIDVGPTRRYSLLDESPSTATSGTSPMSTTVTASAVVTDIILVGATGSSVTVTANGSTVGAATIAAPQSPATSRNVKIAGLNIPAGASIGVVVSGVGVSVSQLLAGKFIDIGETLPGPSVGIADYSSVTANDFGVTSVVRRRYSRRAQGSIRIPTSDVDRVAGALEDLRSTVCWWSFDDSYDCLNVAGYYKDWSIDLSLPTVTTYSLSVEGLARDDVSAAPEAGNLSAPPPITGAVATLAPGGVRIAWNPSTDGEWAGSEWRVGASWSTGVRVFRGAATDFVWLNPPQGAQTLWGINYDSAGEDSAPVALPITVTEAAAIAWSTLSGRPADGDILNTQAAFAAARAWTFQGTADGCTATNATISTGPSSLTLTSSGVDPILTTGAGLGILGAANPRVRARLRRLAGTGWDGSVYYATDGHAIAAGFVKKITADPTIGGAWVVVEWDMAALTFGGGDWLAATVQQIRLDLGASAADVFEIDWIAVGAVAPASYGATWGLNVAGSGAVDTAITTAQQAANNAATAASTAQTSANTALTQLQAIASDSVLARGEKPWAAVDWLEIANGFAGIDDQAAAYSITTERTAYAAAKNALAVYLGALAPQWDDATVDTPIVPATWRSNWDACYQARQTLLNKIAAEAGKRASGLSQSGNMLSNTEFSGLSSKGWSHRVINQGAAAFSAGTELARDPASIWVPPNKNSLYLHQSTPTGNGPASAAPTYSEWYSDPIQITQSTRYEFSAWLSAHSSTQVSIYILWMDAAGTTSVGADPWHSTTLTTGGADIALFTRGLVLATSPATARFAVIIFRKWDTAAAQANSYAWMLQPQLCAAGADQATASPYVPGSVTSHQQLGLVMTGDTAPGLATDSYADIFDFAGAGFNSGAARSFPITPQFDGYIEFDANITASDANPDAGNNVSWRVTPSVGAVIFLGSNQQFTSSKVGTTTSRVIQVSAGITYDFTVNVTRNINNPQVKLYSSTMRFTYIKR